MKAFFLRQNPITLALMAVTAMGITVTGILHQQAFLRILPLYVSLVIGMLQTSANRYAPLIGGINSILYALTYLYLGLYASAAYAFLFSFPVQILTFLRWSKHSYKHSTKFRRMTGKQRLAVCLLFLTAFGLLLLLLRMTDSSHQVLDSLSSLFGILISFLTMLAYVEYTWLMLPSGLLTIALHIATMQDHPAQITYLIFSLYSLICVTRGFFHVRKLYREQQNVSADSANNSNQEVPL